jgi:hypothetical protein
MSKPLDATAVSLIRSRKRVADHGEVFTPPWLVEKMLVLVEGEAGRIDSRFLEPACGSGNFLVPILRRKLAAVELEHGGSESGKRHHALRALTCLYGIELLADNIAECRAAMLEAFAGYLRLEESDELHRAASQILSLNLIHGDAMTMKEGRSLFANPGKPFDVIIGNPPYQRAGGAGGSSDSSIYHLFVQRALELEPRFVSMLLPARWMAGGRGLDEFRAKMLTSGHVRALTDFPDSGTAFPGVRIKGGICYFLWDRDHAGPCDVTRIGDGAEHFQKARVLGEFDVFIRDERALGILRKVLAKDEPSILPMLSGDTPFGIATNFDDWTERQGRGRIPLHLIGGGRRSVGFVKRAAIGKNIEALDVWKVLVPKAYGAGETFPHRILGREIVAGPPSACTQTYLVVSPFQSREAARSFASYYRTRLFRFLVSLRKITQDALRSTYSWVPEQTWDRTWTDEALYAKYGIAEDEIAFIESMIRPMDAGTE